MNQQNRELSVENYKKLGLRDLEQLYTLKIVPHLNKSLDTICTLLKSDVVEKKVGKYHSRAVSLMNQFTQLYRTHSTTELTILTALLARQENDLSVSVAELKESHRQMRKLLEQVSELAEQCTLSPDCSSLHKLGYAYTNNLMQDISRLFFLEEEYLFPRFPLLK